MRRAAPAGPVRLPRITACVSYRAWPAQIVSSRSARPISLSDRFAVSISAAAITAIGLRQNKTPGASSPCSGHGGDVIPEKSVQMGAHLDRNRFALSPFVPSLPVARRSSSRLLVRVLNRCILGPSRRGPSHRPVLSLLQLLAPFHLPNSESSSHFNGLGDCMYGRPRCCKGKTDSEPVRRSEACSHVSGLFCRRSSCSGVGAFAMAQTRGSPRLWASKALTKAAPSTPSVLTRRRRRDVAMEAGSTTGRVPGRGVGVVGASVSCG